MEFPLSDRTAEIWTLEAGSVVTNVSCRCRPTSRRRSTQLLCRRDQYQLPKLKVSVISLRICPINAISEDSEYSAQHI